MTDLARLTADLTALFKTYKIPMEGVSEDYEACMESCCYADARRDDRAGAALRSYAKRHKLPEDVWHFSRGDIDSVRELVQAVRIETCEHSYQLVGQSSAVSSCSGGAVADLWACEHCGIQEYRNRRGGW